MEDFVSTTEITVHFFCVEQLKYTNRGPPSEPEGTCGKGKHVESNPSFCLCILKDP